ncbi:MULTISPECIES: hypothetical protein [Corynebacterium]|uniref:hypothetical protein n=1 Tax=Corynebacterium TaxID=1716 RepID=UPI00254A760F|nr:MULTISPECIES: hypothetical protein [Corynebacterium]MDK6259400.1 hypothetical protein [Corynebacterium frankenforstense]MDK8895539.1 hypothetical protein [Corynebacterium sp. MSK006]
MFSTFTVTLVIAVLAGGLAYYSWGRSATLSLAAGAVCVGVSLIALLMAVFISLAWFMKLVPLVLLAGGVWLVWRVLGRRRDREGALR